MTKGPENSSSPIEHIGSTVAAILLRQRADAAVDVKNSMTAGNLAETIAALDRVNEAIKVADTVQRHLDGAVEGVKTDLGYFPSIRVAHLTQTDLEKPIGVQYQQITESAAIEPSPAIVAPSLATIEPAIGIAPKPEKSNVSQIEQSQPEADFATPGNQREEPVVEISTEPLVEILPKQVDTLAIIEAQVQPSQAEKLGSADLQLTPADNTLIKATEITVETPSIATVVVEHAPRQEVITTENQPQIEGISAQDQLIEAALWEASADNPVTKSHLIDLTGLSKTDLDLAMFKVRKQLEKAGFKVMNSNTKRGPGQVGQFYIQKNEEDPVQTAAKVSPDKSQVAESPSPDLVEDSKVSVIESAETSVNMIAEDTTLNVSEKESTSVGEADDISQYEALLSEIGSGNTYDGRMTALRQAVVFLRKNGSDQTIRGKGLTSLEQKIILAAIDVTEDGKPKNPNRKAIVAEAYADKVPFVESRLPFEVAQNNRFLKTAEEGLPGLIRSTAVKIDRARYTDEGLERTLVMYADLLDEDARTGDMSPSDLERLLRGDLTVHQHQMLLLKVEEDVKKKSLIASPVTIPESPSEQVAAELKKDPPRFTEADIWKLAVLMSRLTEEKKQALASQGIDFSIHPAIEKGIQELITSGKSTYSTPEAIESFKASKSEWAQKFVDFAQNPQDIIANHNNHITIQNTLFALSLFLNSTDDMRKFLKSLT